VCCVLPEELCPCGIPCGREASTRERGITVLPDRIDAHCSRAENVRLAVCADAVEPATPSTMKSAFPSIGVAALRLLEASPPSNTRGLSLTGEYALPFLTARMPGRGETIACLPNHGLPLKCPAVLTRNLEMLVRAAM